MLSERMLDVEPMGDQRVAGPVTERTNEWLSEMGLGECFDPNAMILVEASMDLDELNAGKLHLSAKDMVAARGKVRHTITTARRALQSEINAGARHRVAERHRLIHGDLAARTMGWIDADLLSPTLREAVGNWLEAEHGITLADYAPEEVAI